MKIIIIILRILWISFLSGFSFLLSSCEKEANTLIYSPIIPGAPGWSPLVTETSENLNDIYFINNNSGWIVGENQTLIATASGDLGWSLAPVNLPLENLRSVFFADDQIGWLAGDLSGIPIMGQVGYTSNGGGYPVQQEIFEKPLNTLFFVDRQAGWAAGEGGLLVKTHNGGQDWEIFPPFTDKTIYDLIFLDDGSGWAAAGNGEIFSTDEGMMWVMEETGIDTDILSIQILDETHGWACGVKNKILRKELTEDGTVIWIHTTIGSLSVNQIWNDIFFVNFSTGWVVGEFGEIYKTTDGGVNWIPEESNVVSDLNAIFMVGTSKGWIVGDDGIILSYTAQ